MAPLVPTVHIGDRVKMRKPHPCGGDVWEVVRLGADIGLCCLTCNRRVMLARGDFNKGLKQIVEPAAAHQREGDTQR